MSLIERWSTPIDGGTERRQREAEDAGRRASELRRRADERLLRLQFIEDEYDVRSRDTGQ